MSKRIGYYPRLRVSGGGSGVVSQAGGVLLVETARRTGLADALSAALAPWRKPRAVHDPGKILLDVALAVALGGDCLADVAMLRAEPAVFGPVASDPTVSRLVDALATAGPRVLAATRRDAGSGDRCGHAAWRAGVVMTVSNSTGVSRPSEVCLRRR